MAGRTEAPVRRAMSPSMAVIQSFSTTATRCRSRRTCRYLAVSVVRRCSRAWHHLSEWRRDHPGPAERFQQAACQSRSSRSEARGQRCRATGGDHPSIGRHGLAAGATDHRASPSWDMLEAASDAARSCRANAAAVRPQHRLPPIRHRKTDGARSDDCR